MNSKPAIQQAIAVIAVLALAGLVACGTDDPEVNTNEATGQTDVGGDTGDHGGGTLDVNDGLFIPDADDNGGGSVDVNDGLFIPDADDNGDPDDVGGGEDTGADDIGGDDQDTGGVDAGADTGDDEDTGTGGEALEGDTCETAIDVTEGAELNGESTLEMTDQYDPSTTDCSGTNSSDRDRVYVVQPEETTSYTVRVEPQEPDNFDVMIYVREDCEALECLAATRFNGPGEAEQLSFEAQANTPTFIIVDGDIGGIGSSWSGTFDLSVTIEE